MSLAGLGLGPPLLAMVCCISVYNMYLLMKCANSLAWRFKGEQLGYGDVVQMAFRVSVYC